jgi:hypothetical protein
VNRTRAAASTAGAALLVALAAGCGNTALPGSASPNVPVANQPSSGDMTTPSSSNGARHGAPRVAHPLNAAAFVSKSCSSLTVSDLSAIGMTGAQSSGADSDAVGTGCSWTLNEKAVNVGWETSDPDGLSDLYALKPQRAYWYVLTVSGYPAVESDAVDDRSDGGCQVNVGVNDHLFFLVSVEGASSGDQACSQAKQTGAAVIANLQAVQGGS